MRKRFLGILIIAVVALAVSATVGFLIFRFAPDTIAYTPKSNISVNYNNYIRGGNLDYKDGRMVWYNSSLQKTTLVTADGSSVVAGGEQPQLAGDTLFYIKNQNLMQTDLSTGKVKTIEKNVDNYYALPDRVYCRTYSTVAGDTYVIRYDLKTCSKTVLCDNNYDIYFHNGRLYTVDFDGEILCFDAHDTCTIIDCLEVLSWPFDIRFQGNYIIYEHANSIYFVDPQTGDSKVIDPFGRTDVNDSFQYICDDTDIYISFHASVTYGSVVGDIDHESNGLWHINPQNGEKTKLCDTTFETLYLFDGELFGVTDHTLYQINTKNGDITKLS